MEFFLEIFSTIAISLLVSFFVSKLLSLESSSTTTTTSTDHHHHAQTYECAADSRSSTPFQYDFIDQSSTNLDTETEKNIVNDDDQVVDDRDCDVEFDNDLFREDVNLPKTGYVVGGVEEENLIQYDDVVEGSHEETKFFEKDPLQYVKDEEVRVLKREDLTDRSDDIARVDKIDLEDDHDDDDDWEGIERSDLEKQFGAAVRCASRLELSSDVQMQLYGLHKVATEGPCHEPQPMAFKMSARTKWRAWQRLGNLSQEAAMEQYINLLAQNTGWMEEDPNGGDKLAVSDTGASSNLTFELKKVTTNETVFKNER